MIARWGTWHVALGLACAAWLALEGWVLARDRRPAHGTLADRGSSALIVAAVGLGVASGLYSAYHPRWPLPLAPPVLLSAALTLIGMGLTLRLWAILTLGRHFRAAVFVHTDHALVATGPYRRLRNPAYTGSLMVLLGLGIALGNGLSMACMVLLPLAGYLWRIRVEEAVLQRHFGESYRRYRSSTWRLLPGVW